MQTDQGQLSASSPIRLSVGTASLGDVKAAVRAGLRDSLARPGLSLFFGLVYAVLGGALIAGLAVFDQIWIVIAVAVGFPLVAPFLAAGLYEMSRRLKRGQPFSAADILLVVLRQRRREFGWMSFVVLFVFWVWAYQVRLVLALTLHYRHFRSVEDLVVGVFTTSGGALFLMIGTLVGAVLATVLYSLTVIAMPLLLDKDVDFVTAMITSVRAVLASPVVMLGWGAVVGALTLLAVAPALVGVVFVFPVLGHASWHLYERLVKER